MIYEMAVNGLLAAYSSHMVDGVRVYSEADHKLIRAACNAIYQAGILHGMHQGLSAAKVAFAASAASGEVKHETV